MLVKTRCFGDIELPEEKIIIFDDGIMGFEKLKRYTILFDVEEGTPTISWLQSVEEASLAIPIINPLLIKEDYNPVVEDELLKTLGELTEENIVIYTTVTVPEDIESATVNLKAPIIINSETRKGCQIIVENNDYPVKYNIYEKLSEIQKSKEEE